MEYYRYFPKHPEIQKVVNFIFWVKHPALEHKKDQFLMPEGCFDLIFSLESKYNFHHDTSSGTTPNVFFFGMNHRKISLSTMGKLDTVAIKFHPGGLAAIIHVNQSELSGQLVEANHFFRKDQLDKINEILLSSVSIEQKMHAMELFLLNHLKNKIDPRVEYSLNQIKNSNEHLTVSKLAEQINTSERHLRQLFHENVGVSPKAFLKINRFQKVFQLLKSNEGKKGLTQIAYLLGYSDQSHFIKECQSVALQSPKKLLKELSTSVFYNF